MYFSSVDFFFVLGGTCPAAWTENICAGIFRTTDSAHNLPLEGPIWFELFDVRYSIFETSELCLIGSMKDYGHLRDNKKEKNSEALR